VRKQHDLSFERKKEKNSQTTMQLHWISGPPSQAKKLDTTTVAHH
jgi:hypothetical protein